MNAKSILRNCSTIFLLAGSLLLGGYAFLTGQTEIYHARDRARLALLMAKAPPVTQTNRAYEASLATPVLKTGSILGELQIPRVGIDAIVLEGDTSRILRRGAGHIPGTALPTRLNGNVGIAGHRDTYFRPLRFIRPGDFIILKTPTQNYRYRVQSARVVEPNDVAVLHNTKHPTLTLVTCYPFYYVGPAPHRFIVQATEIPPN